MSEPTRPVSVVVWGENRHEQLEREVARRYPDGMHEAIARGIREHASRPVDVRTVTLDDPEQGLPDDLLDTTDVGVWWGHAAHAEVDAELVDRLHQRVLAGMGLVVLHSGHWSKIFTRLMGTTCTLRWRSEHDREIVWTVHPAHPIAAGVPQPLIIEEQEMYGEFFDIPVPDELIFISSFSGGEVFRSGCTWTRGNGRVFYFSPGDQDFPVYHHAGVQRVIANGVLWAAPSDQPRVVPELLRYAQGEFTAGEDYTGPLRSAELQ